ncbi:MAG: hypothetical protein MUF60_01255 [Vicinamibacterales bacterium]|jgi:hypothetical protein|nr:hypothetical protein [Vicinamibacterales bacterium]
MTMVADALRKALLLAGGVGLGLVIAACADVTPTGPSLSDVQVTGLRTVPTTDNPGLCCCRAVGTAVNRNSVPVHVTLKISAYANPPGADPVASLIYFIKDFQPGATHAIDAPGILFPCASISPALKYEVEVRGLTFPPL